MDGVKARTRAGVLVCCALGVIGSGVARAQPQAPAGPSSGASAEHEAILTVVDQFLRAIANNDGEAMVALRTEGAVEIIESPDGKGGTRIIRRTLDPASVRSGTYLERYWDPIVHIRGRLAIVWTPYEFMVNGKTTHCGVDAFEMIRQDEGWRIGNILYTVEREGCEAMRPTDPSRMRPRP